MAAWREKVEAVNRPAAQEILIVRFPTKKKAMCNGM
jgi:hypothetical protein